MARRHSKERFIEKSQKVHGNRYDYSTSRYVNDATQIQIVCRKHGVFKQKANTHLRGSGCPNCALEDLGRSHQHTKTDFISKARKMHGKRYKYTTSQYVNDRTKLQIICRKHGPFLQTPNSHLRGSGCPRCRQSRAENSLAVLFSSYGIKFKQNDRKLVRRLFVDFYLPEESLAVEASGEQHWSAIKLWGGSNKLRIRKNRDRRKERELQKLGIKLLVIPYTVPKELYPLFLWFRHVAGEPMRTHKNVKSLKGERLKMVTDWLKDLRGAIDGKTPTRLCSTTELRNLPTAGPVQ